MAVMVVVVLLRSTGIRRVLLISMLAGAMISSGLLVSRYTDLGIFLLDGDEFWVRQAASEPDDHKQECCLRVALSGTQYALNTVENEVLALYADQPSVRAEHFATLARLAPNEGWAYAYDTHCEAALEASKGAALLPRLGWKVSEDRYGGHRLELPRRPSVPLFLEQGATMTGSAGVGEALLLALDGVDNTVSVRRDEISFIVTTDPAFRSPEGAFVGRDRSGK